jgi:hypothetical protein
MARYLFSIKLAMLATLSILLSACFVGKYYVDRDEQLSPQAEALLASKGLTLTYWLKGSDVGSTLARYLKEDSGQVVLKPVGECEVIMNVVTLGLFPGACYSGVKVEYCGEMKYLKFEENLGWWFSSIVALFPGWTLFEFESEKPLYRGGAAIKLTNELAQNSKNNCE